MFKRVIVIVLDSLGIGAALDAERFGDVSANTLKSAISGVADFKVPNLEKLGLGHIFEDKHIKKIPFKGYVTKMHELSIGKDTTVGHWEFMGIETKIPFPVFTNTGFPKALMDELTKRTGYEFLGNKASSGTVILDEYGEEHLKSKKLIIYTSNDSVLQIAAHEDLIPLEELYRVCEIAREVTLEPQWRVARIIARPFIGKVGDFKRTANRHDYSLSPPSPTVLDNLVANNYEVLSIGKIADIYNGMGISKSIKTVSNHDGMQKIMEAVEKEVSALIFANLVEFDSEYGHRRDKEGYGKAIMEFDQQLGELLPKLNDDDLLILTADHGNDPGFVGSDHTRELVPLIVYNNLFTEGNLLEERKSFADLGATIAENFKIDPPIIGTSFFEKLK